MEQGKVDISWLVGRCEGLLEKNEASANRYIEAESFLCELLRLPWWKRLFFSRRMISLFIKNQLKKYN